MIDRYGWGCKSKSEPRPQPVYSAAERSSGRWLKKITMTHLAEHLAREDTFYYTSLPKSPTHLLCVDIDAHNGERDAQDLSRWIVAQWFPGAYWEPSTNGLGVHLYLAIDVGYLPRLQFRSLISEASNSFVRCLAAVSRNEGFEATVDTVCGKCCHWEDGQAYLVNDLAKIPRPSDEAALDGLVQAPVFDLYALRQVWEECRVRNLGVTMQDAESGIHPSPEKHLFRDYSPELPRPDSLAHQLMTSSDAWERSRGQVIALWQELGREPSPQEVSIAYDTNVLGTGLSDRDRDKRHVRAIKSVSKGIDTTKLVRPRYQPGKYLELLKSLLTIGDLIQAAADTGYRYKLTYEDLDVALDYHTLETLKRKDGTQQFTVPEAGMVSWIRALKDKQTIQRSTDFGKIAAARCALLRAGLITSLGRGYTPARMAADGKGIAKKYGLGEHHPRYGEFASLLEKVRHDPTCPESPAAHAQTATYGPG
jgi:hypothetical protein